MENDKEQQFKQGLEEMKPKPVLAKLLQARVIISKTKKKKEGQNKFSNYSYFTPSQVSALVTGACEKVGLLPVFKLVTDGEDKKGLMTVYCTETGDSIEFESITAIPDIKATNATQKLGGAITYTERYLNMIAFAIADDAADFDSHDNRPKKQTKKAPAKKTKPDGLTPERFKEAIKAIQEEKCTIKAIKKVYDLTEEQEQQLNEL